MFHEARRGNNRHPAALDIGFIYDAPYSTEVVGMGVGKDHRHHRTLAQFFVNEGEGGIGGFLTGERIKDNPAGVTLDKANIGQIETPDLIYFARHYFIEAIGHVQNGLPL